MYGYVWHRRIRNESQQDTILECVNERETGGRWSCKKKKSVKVSFNMWINQTELLFMRGEEKSAGRVERVEMSVRGDV